MSDDTPIDDTTGGLDRRSLIKRGAIVGGALVWTTPVVQAIASPAFGATPSDDDNDDDDGPVCADGLSETRSYFVKIDVNTGAVEFSFGTGATCVIDGFDAATKGLPPGTNESQFTVTVTSKTATEQIAEITLPPGFVATAGAVKAGNDKSDTDLDTNLVGCFNSVAVDQTGSLVTVETTNTDGNKKGVNPGFSFVALVFTGCVLAPAS